MPYCTLAQLAERYGATMLVQLSDRGTGEAPEEPDPDLFDRAIADADALIDGYLRKRYALPLPALPRLVTDLSLRIAIYYAHGQAVTDKVREDYRDALKTLEKIAAGLVELDLDGAEPPASGASEVRTEGSRRTFTERSMRGYI